MSTHGGGGRDQSEREIREERMGVRALSVTSGTSAFHNSAEASCFCIRYLFRELKQEVDCF